MYNYENFPNVYAYPMIVPSVGESRKWSNSIKLPGYRIGTVYDVTSSRTKAYIRAITFPIQALANFMEGYRDTGN
jgi:hypothetical protein